MGFGQRLVLSSGRPSHAVTSVTSSRETPRLAWPHGSPTGLSPPGLPMAVLCVCYSSLNPQALRRYRRESAGMEGRGERRGERRREKEESQLLNHPKWAEMLPGVSWAWSVQKLSHAFSVPEKVPVDGNYKWKSFFFFLSFFLCPA